MGLSATSFLQSLLGTRLVFLPENIVFLVTWVSLYLELFYFLSFLSFVSHNFCFSTCRSCPKKGHSRFQSCDHLGQCHGSRALAGTILYLESSAFLSAGGRLPNNGRIYTRRRLSRPDDLNTFS